MARETPPLPWYALGLLRRCWAPLLCVHAAGALVHYASMGQVARLGLRDEVLGLLGVAFTLMVTLVTLLVMFQIVRPAAAPGVEDRPGPRNREGRLVRAVSVTVFPFLVLYSGWDLIGEEFRVYAHEASARGGLGALEAVSDFDPVGLPLLIALAAYGVRTALERLHRGGEAPLLGPVAAVFEAVWVFFAVVSVGRVLAGARDWLTGREAWVAAGEAGTALAERLAGLVSLPVPEVAAALAAAAAACWELLAEGVAEPVMWLTIAAVAFGTEADRAESLFQDDRPVRLPGEGRLPRLRGQAGRIGGLAVQGLRDKYVPFFNALRFVLRVGPVFFLGYCLAFALLRLGTDLLHRGLLLLAAPGDLLSGLAPVLPMAGAAADAVHQVLLVCLLAAAFELVVRRLGADGRRPAAAGRPAG